MTNFAITIGELSLLLAIACKVASAIWRDMDKRELNAKAVVAKKRADFDKEVESAGMRVKIERWRYQLDKWQKNNKVEEALIAAAECIDAQRNAAK